MIPRLKIFYWILVIDLTPTYPRIEENTKESATKFPLLLLEGVLQNLICDSN